MEIDQVGTIVVQMMAWAAVGIVALFAARVAYHLFTPFEPRKELVEDRNAAVGVSNGLYVVAAAIVLHGVIRGERLEIALWQEVLLMVGLYVLGLALLWFGRIALRVLSRFDLDEEIHVKDNLAVGILEGCSYVGFAIIIHAAL